MSKKFRDRCLTVGRQFYAYKASLAVIAAVWVLCLTPVPEPTFHVPTNTDKAVHAGMYFTICSVMWWERRRKLQAGGQALLPTWLTHLLLPVAMGGIIEVVQPFVNRSCDLWDFLSNSFGAVCAFVLYRYLL